MKVDFSGIHFADYPLHKKVAFIINPHWNSSRISRAEEGYKWQYQQSQIKKKNMKPHVWYFFLSMRIMRMKFLASVLKIFFFPFSNRWKSHTSGRETICSKVLPIVNNLDTALLSLLEIEIYSNRGRAQNCINWLADNRADAGFRRANL